MSTNMIRRSLAPSERAASTYSFSLIDSVCPRTTRPTAAQLKNAMTAIADREARPDDRDERDREEQERERRARRPCSGRGRCRRSAEIAGREADDDADEHGEARSRRRRRAARPACRRRCARARRGRGRRCRTRNCELGPRGRPSGVRPVSRYWSSGPCPASCAMSGARSATSAISTITTAQAIATRSRRSLAQASCQGLRPSIASGRGSAGGWRRTLELARRPGSRRSLSADARHQLLARLDREVARRGVFGGSPACVSSGGSSSLQQRPRPCGQRGWKRQPGGGSIGEGRSPPRTIARAAAAVLVDHRHRREQRVRVRVPRAREELVGRRDLDDLAEVHDGDPVAHVADDREVVRDEEVGEPQLVLQVGEQVEDLRLDRDVERRDRLVADDQLGMQRERARDADALALTAGEVAGKRL